MGGMSSAYGIKNVSNPVIGTTMNDSYADFPTRLEHSYYNDNVYWSLAPINMRDPYSDISDSIYPINPNTTIHPRISWKATQPSTTATELPNSDFGTAERKWVWPTTTASTIMTTFPFERLTHAYDTHKEEGGKQNT